MACSPARQRGRPACAFSSSPGQRQRPVTRSFTAEPALAVERARARALAVPRAADRVPQPDRALWTGAAGPRRVARRGRVAALTRGPPRGAHRLPPADGQPGRAAVADAAVRPSDRLPRANPRGRGGASPSTPRRAPSHRELRRGARPSRGPEPGRPAGWHRCRSRLRADAAAEDADRSLPRDVLPAEPVLVAEEDAAAARGGRRGRAADRGCARDRDARTGARRT